ncbi:ribosomal L7Ae/L30e/S12e/Gadd45 family protein [Candidatus Woesearchaeota archaeon]|nr:ribosomal L7Ae/L30e/S12e/Gadd45 family protein [Candidatus Woesearchaeota archaeon]
MEKMNDTKELQVKVAEKKILVGTDSVIKALRSGDVTKVVVARNCPAAAKQDLSHYAQLVGVPVMELDLTNDELGVLCKKNFAISVVGIR